MYFFELRPIYARQWLPVWTWHEIDYPKGTSWYRRNRMKLGHLTGIPFERKSTPPGLMVFSTSGLRQ